MNIALVGPQKYDFQDLVCADVMLQFAETPSASFWAEPEGGEDGQLDMDGKTFEIQVKGAVESVTLVEIVDYLTHFPPRSSKNTLLERVLADNRHYAVFVLSGRCDDTTSVLATTTFPTSAAPLDRVKMVTAEALITRLKAAAVASADATTLETNRLNHLQGLAKSLKVSVVRKALSRVFLIERLDASTLENRFAKALTEKHAIPLDRIPDVISRCREIVKAAKGKDRDALLDLRSEMVKFARASVMPQNYVARGAEPVWTERLAKSVALLVTGRPRTGKSSAARAVAASYQKMGYEVLITADFATAERYLDDPRPLSRLAVLDDPLGGAYPEPDAGRILQKLGKLIERLGTDRKIVVAQSREQLLIAAMMPSIGEIKTGGLVWLELTDGDPTFLETIWAAEADRSNVPDELKALVGVALGRRELVLEPGSISHLAANHGELHAPYSLYAAETLARQDSKDIAAAWKSEGLQPVVRAIAIGTTSFEDIGPRELAFILGSGGTSLPGKPVDEHMGIIFGGDEEHNPPDPAYEFAPLLSVEQADQCDLLEQRGVIRWDDERLDFSHPIYRAAAQFAAGGYTQQQAASLLEAFQRAIFSENAKTARAAARNAEWLFDRLRGRKEQAKLVERAEEALGCFYPSVRDVCFEFLVRHFDDLENDLKDRLPKWVDNVTRVEIPILEWREGEARLPLGKNVGLESLSMEMTGLSASQVASERSILEGKDGGYLSAEGAVRALLFYRQKPVALSRTAVIRLLSYGEGFIRAEAAAIWLAAARHEDSDVLERIARDEHPRVASDALDGAIKGWPHMSQARRNAVTSILKVLAKIPTCATAMMPQLVRFSRVEYTGTTPPWELFAHVMPTALRSAPAGASISEVRLLATIRDGSPYLPTENIVNICDAWIDWLEGELLKGNFPGEYAAGVCDILVPATTAAPERRAGRLCRLVNLPGTSTTHSVLVDLLYHWENLTLDERALAAGLITSHRTDRVWLRAAVLTAHDVPPDLERLILGPVLRLSAGAEKLIADMAPALLDACVFAYTGWIGQLWNKAHAGGAIWAPIIDVLSTRPDHRLFPAAWFELTLAGDGSAVAEAIKVMGPSFSEKLVDLLIADKVDRTGDFMPEVWKVALDFAPDLITRNAWLARTIPFLPAILEDLRDVAEWLPADDHDLIFGALESDTSALQIARAISNSGVGKQGLLVVQQMLEQNPAILHGTYLRLRIILEEFEERDADFFKWLNERRIEVLEEGRRIREKLRFRAPEAQGWMAP